MKHNPTTLTALTTSPDPMTRLRALRLMRYQIEAGQPPEDYLELARSLFHDPDDDCRWQAVLVVGKSLKTSPELVWQIACEFGESADEDMRDAVATLLLQELLESEFDKYYPRLKDRIDRGAPLLADTLRRTGASNPDETAAGARQDGHHGHDASLAAMDLDGFVLLRGVFSSAEIDNLTVGLTAALHGADGDGESIRTAVGGVYAARNVLELYPPARIVWRKPAVLEFLSAVLGPNFGLVRALFFDKPPERSWSLPWHKDLTIAVRDNQLPSDHFSKPTRKAGVPHVEAPLDLLEMMLTLRIHLDDVHRSNGPLKVAPGSHRTGKELCLGAAPAEEILCSRGDVLAMRPLLAHCSGTSAAGTDSHRRILHLEFSGCRDLPDGYAWHEFVPA